MDVTVPQNEALVAFLILSYFSKSIPCNINIAENDRTAESEFPLSAKY